MLIDLPLGGLIRPRQSKASAPVIVQWFRALDSGTKTRGDGSDDAASHSLGGRRALGAIGDQAVPRSASVSDRGGGLVQSGGGGVPLLPARCSYRGLPPSG